MSVDPKADSVVVKVVYRVEMLKEGITNQEKVLILSRKTALVNDEVALVVAGLVQVLLRVDLKHIITHLESDWLDLRSDVFATIFHMAERLIGSAIEIRKCLLPFGSNFLKNIWRDRKLTAASINDGRIACVFTRFLHWLVAVVHSLTFKSPRA